MVKRSCLICCDEMLSGVEGEELRERGIENIYYGCWVGVVVVVVVVVEGNGGGCSCEKGKFLVIFVFL